MENYNEALRKQLEELNALLCQSEKNLKKLKGVPDKRVIASRSNGCDQFYYRNPGEKQIKYVKAEERELVSKIVQRDYETSMNKQLRFLCKQLERFLKTYDIDSIFDIYEKSCTAKQKLIKPLIMPKEEFVKAWYDEHPGNLNRFAFDVYYETDRGEFVRSKSEKILADMFYKNAIPYVYEPKIFLGPEGRVSFPDFALLNVRTRKIFYWEHLGMCSDPEYAIKNLGKIRRYEENGYFLGDQLLISIESEDNPLTVKSIEEMIEKYLK